MKHHQEYQHCGFFVLRNPLLPFDSLSALFDGKARTRDSLKSEEDILASKALAGKRLWSILDDPKVREALWLASPGLFGRLSDQGAAKDSDKAADMLPTLYKYFTRMTTRCTPFGLFAVCSMGRVDGEMCFDVRTSAPIKRVTRLDTEYLYRLIWGINADKGLRGALRYRANTSLYPAGERLHYAEAEVKAGGQGVSYRLSAVDGTDYLARTLERARLPVALAALAQALCDDDPEIMLEEATQFIDGLVDNQLLQPEIIPPVTGDSALSAIATELDASLATAAIAARLRDVERAIQELDASGVGAEMARYESVTEQLKSLPAAPDVKNLFQVDAMAGLGTCITEDLAADVLMGAQLLQSIQPSRPEGMLDRFKRDFTERYVDQEMPLSEVLDDDMGIGFAGSQSQSASIEPLLAGIRIPGAQAPGGAGMTAHEPVLMERLQALARDGGKELKLDDRLLSSMKNPQARPLPDAFEAFIELHVPQDGGSSQRFHLRTVAGPSGVKLLGRFCHLDADLTEAVSRHVKAEEALNPDATYAEVVHMPEGRVGNILQRPVLREHEIVYLGRSGAAEEHQIALSDLTVSVRGDRIILRSKRLNRRIVPRLTSAHNYSSPINLRTYRFLCLLQSEGIANAVMWNWGALGNMAFLPRVTRGQMVLAPASWSIDRDQTKVLLGLTGLKRYQEVQKLRAERSLPRCIVVAEADNHIPFDLEDPLSIDVFCDFLSKYRLGLRVTETLGSEEELPLRIDGRPYVNEIILPFVRRPESHV